MRWHVSAALRSNHRKLTEAEMKQLEKSLIDSYFSDNQNFPADLNAYFSTPEGQGDLHSHLMGRLADFRFTVIPWLNATVPLYGKRILEIGSGTGASAVALAEQAAHVVGMDVSNSSLTVAKARCALYKMDAEFLVGNAQNVVQLVQNRNFDCIIFFAALEHMTLEETREVTCGCMEHSASRAALDGH